MTPEAEIEQLSAAIAANPADAVAYYRRGNLYWKLGNRGKALTDFNTSAHLDPEGPGSAAAENALQILDFFNPQNP